MSTHPSPPSGPLSAHGRRPRHRVTPRHGRSHRLEALEDRRLMAVNIFEYSAALRAALPALIAPGSGLPLYVTEVGRNAIAVVDPATLNVTQEVSVPTPNSAPLGLADGPDGRIWFTEALGNKIGALDKTTGLVQEFALPSADSVPVGITAGPDDRLWFTEVGGNRIGVIDPTTHAIQEFALPTSNSAPIQIVAGPDGKLWFTELENDSIGVIDPTSHAIQEFAVPDGGSPFGITTGPGGQLWFTEPGDGEITSIDPTSHAFQSIDLPTSNGEPTGIVTGPDGNLWFTESLGNAIGTIDRTTLVVTEHTVPTVLSAPLGITLGDDGNLYFTEAFAGKVGRVRFPLEGATTPDALGTTTQLPVVIEDAPLPNAGGGLYGIVTGPDQNLWFTESIANRIGTINPTTHVVSHIAIPTEGARPLGIARLNNRLWFTEGANKIGAVDPATRTVVEYAIPTANSGPVGIAAGPDGKLWFTESFVGQIGVFDPATQTFEEFALGSAKARPLGITAGPDGKLWFTEGGPGKIGVIDPISHAIQEFALPTSDNGPWSIVSGPGGQLWFTEATGDRLGSIDPASHAIQEYPIPGSLNLPLGIAAGPDGQLWFTQALGNAVGAFNPTTRTFTDTSVTTQVAGPAQITPGPDGNLWFTEFLAGNVGLAQLQPFPVTVALTGPTAPTTVGTPVQFRATVTPGVAGTLDGQVVFTIDGVAQPPRPISLVDGTYQATFTTSTLTAGTHRVVATYQGDSAFATAQSNVVTATVQPQVITDGPRVTSLQRFGYHAQPTTLVLTFNRALDATTASDPRNYLLVGPGGSRITLRSVRYVPESRSVVLAPTRLLALSQSYRLTVNGSTATGVRDTNGLLLDGTNSGQPGSDYRAVITRRNLVIPTRPVRVVIPRWPLQ